MDMLKDVRKEYEKKEEKFKKVIAEILAISPSLMRRNVELGEKWKKVLHDYYETAAKLEDAQGLIVKFINICPLTRTDIDRLYLRNFGRTSCQRNVNGSLGYLFSNTIPKSIYRVIHLD